jgi:hypothetical protein
VESNRILLIFSLIVVVVGGVILWRQLDAKSKKPVMGWHELGAEEFDLKPGAHHGFSYREVPPTFRIEVHANQPVAFGFVTAEVFGRYNSTLLPLDFATLPCGNASTTDADLHCSTESDKRYILLTDTREDVAPEGKKSRGNPQPATALLENHVSVKMYDWRCIDHCENLPAGHSAG